MIPMSALGKLLGAQASRALACCNFLVSSLIFSLRALIHILLLFELGVFLFCSALATVRCLFSDTDHACDHSMKDITSRGVGGPPV